MINDPLPGNASMTIEAPPAPAPGSVATAAPPAPPEPAGNHSDLRAITGDGVAFSLMVGAGETYMPAFALAVHAGETAAGLLSALPLLGGALLQLVSPWAIERLKSHRRWVLLCASIQAMSFAPLVLGALLGRIPTVMLFLAVTVYWGAGLATGPAWNTWVTTLVPPRMRIRFFAYRSRMGHAALLVGLVGAGFALHLGKANHLELAVFAVIFGLAGIFRLVSASFLSRQSEPVPLPPNRRGVPPMEILRRARRNADGRLLLYMLAVQAAVQISGPFFTPYMFKQIHLSYAQYLILIATSFGAKMTALPLLGRLGHRYGAQFLLYTGGIGIVPLSALWLVSDEFAYLLLVQLVAGSIWAAYELGTFLLLFERIDVQERTSILTIFNLASAVATVGGALFGAAVLALTAEGRHGYEMLFGLSCAARLLSLVLLARLHPGAAVQPEPAVSVRALAARPNTGSLDAPIVAGMDERGAVK